ncbi:MAG TPA: hypothetical protein VLN45_08815, partial [Ignavibacteriaceae bacterium]|nr:hypothetical protein [Ignavibacteriaceae bacterium]
MNNISHKPKYLIRRRNFFLCFLLLIVVLIFSLYSQERAQPGQSENIPYEIKTNTLNEKEIAEEIKNVKLDLSRISKPKKNLQKYFNDPEFIYDRKAAMPLSIWDNIRIWINKKLRELFSSEGYSTFFDYLLYALIAFSLIMIILGLLKTDLRGLIYPAKNKNYVSGINETDEDINKINLDNLIEDALKKKEFRLATRYLYL